MLVLLSLLLASASASIKSCGGLFTIQQLGLEPSDKAVGGTNVSLTLYYTSPLEVTGGSVKNSMSYNFIPLAPTITDLCQNTQCPITIGPHDGSSWYTMPSGLSGTITSRILWSDTAGTQLLCLDMTLKVVQTKPY